MHVQYMTYGIMFIAVELHELIILLGLYLLNDFLNLCSHLCSRISSQKCVMLLTDQQ